MRVPIASVRGLLILTAAWFGVAAVVAFEVWPLHPGSIGGWLLFVIAAPPCFLLASAIAKWGWTTRPAKYISQHPTRFVRLALGVIVGGLLFAVLSAAWIAVGHWAGTAVV